MLRYVSLDSMIQFYFSIFWKSEFENRPPVSICTSDALHCLRVDLGNVPQFSAEGLFEKRSFEDSIFPNLTDISLYCVITFSRK